MNARYWLRLWFGLTEEVDQRTYLMSGLVLMLARYLGDTAIIAATGTPTLVGPLQYLHPSLGMRTAALGLEPAALVLMGLWALPFAWVGVNMSIRRARDAGGTPWIGLLFFLPLINLLLIAGLCAAPTSSRPQAPTNRGFDPSSPFLASALKAISVSVALGLGVVALSVFGLGAYGSAMFVGAPFLMGVVGGWLINKDSFRGYRSGLGVALLSCCLLGGAMLLLAMEGILCLAMATPIALTLSMLGSLVGTTMAAGWRAPQRSVSAMVLLLPVLGLGEELEESLPLQEVSSLIHIEASPEEVWPNVIGFSELPPPEDWLMKTGVACPLRATIDGEGVGAIRYCEFTTGPFVEPITVWEPPYNLGFDVVEQPPSMEEWSPYQAVHAPHLVGTMVSRRGAFELTRLPSGGTRLRGTTWYTLDMAPLPYWALWSDWVVHHIHERVLGHIKTLSEGSS